MSDHQEVLESWCHQLVDALELEGLTVDIDDVLGLAGEAAHGIVRPAAPLTTFIVGFAAGCASATDQASDRVAITSASAVARRLVRERAANPPDSGDDDGASGRDGSDGDGSDGGAAARQSTGRRAAQGRQRRSGMDAQDEDASAAQAQEAVQSTFWQEGPPEGGQR